MCFWHERGTLFYSFCTPLLLRLHPALVPSLQIRCENKHSDAEESFGAAKHGIIVGKSLRAIRVRFSTQSNYYNPAYKVAQEQGTRQMTLPTAGIVPLFLLHLSHKKHTPKPLAHSSPRSGKTTHFASPSPRDVKWIFGDMQAPVSHRKPKETR